MDCGNLTMKLDVDIREHKGVIQTLVGDYEVVHPHWRVFVSNLDGDGSKPVFVGYLGKNAGDFFNGSLELGEMPVELQDEIVKAIEDKSGRKIRARIPLNYRKLEEEAAEADGDTDIEDEGEE